MNLGRKLRRIQAIYSEHSRQFGKGNFLSFTVAFVPRIIFVLHAVFSIQLLKKYLRYENIKRSSNSRLKVVWQPTTIDIEPIYAGLILLAFESIYTILVRKGHEYKHIWLSGFFYLMTQIPVVCCIEYAFFQKRRAYHRLKTGHDTSNETLMAFTKAPYHPDTFLNCFHKGIELNCTEKFIKSFSELGLITVIIIGRWMMPRGELTRDQLSALLIGYVNTAADLTEFIGLFSKKSLSREKMVIVVVLALYCVSLLQFVVITTSTTYEYSENEKDVIKSLTANSSNSKEQRYLEPYGAKLNRVGMMQNIDYLTKDAFSRGRRAGKRRRGIAMIYRVGKHSVRRTEVIHSQQRENGVGIQEVSDDSKANLLTKPADIPTENQVIGASVTSRESLNKYSTMEAHYTSSPKRWNERLSKQEKWRTNLYDSARLDAIRRSLLEENWKELSQTLLNMKASKRTKMNMRVESAALNKMKEYNQEEQERRYHAGEESNENEDDDINHVSCHGCLQVVQTEIGGILIALFLQEIPFFFSRIVFIYQHKVFDRGLIFYTTKNLFMLCFLNYRLWVATKE